MPEQSAGDDKTPGRITVWVCPECGYWRDEQASGVHQVFKTTGPARLHKLVKASYVYEETCS